METAELKKRLIAKIIDTENNEILESMMRWSGDVEEDTYILNEAQKAAIERNRSKGLLDIL